MRTGKIGPLGNLRDRERERTQIGAARGHQIGFLGDHALCGVLGFLRGVAGIEHDQLELGAAERLDAALRVDVFHRPSRRRGASPLPGAHRGPRSAPAGRPSLRTVAAPTPETRSDPIDAPASRLRRVNASVIFVMTITP